MLALSLAHGSVNSLLGPLAQRGVQGCMEINQQLTSSHHFRSRFDSQDLTGSERGRGTNNPVQTSFLPSSGKPAAENVEVKNGSDKVGYTRHDR